MTASSERRYHRLHSIPTQKARTEKPMEPQPPAASESPEPAPGSQPPSEPVPAWSDRPTGYVPQPIRPGSVTIASVVLIVQGVLVGILGFFFLLVGVMFPTIISMQEFRDQFGDISEAAGSVFVLFGLLFLADGILQVVSGGYALPGRPWARITGLIAGVLGALIALVGVLPAEGTAGVNLFFVVMLIGYVYVVWVLVANGAWFRR